MLTHYEDMKGDEKWGVKGHPRSSETSPFDRARMTSYLTLIETIHLVYLVPFSSFQYQSVTDTQTDTR